MTAGQNDTTVKIKIFKRPVYIFVSKQANVFVTVIHFYPSLICLWKARNLSYEWKKPPALPEISAKMEVTNNDKHSFILWHIVNNNYKRFCSAAQCAKRQQRLYF